MSNNNNEQDDLNSIIQLTMRKVDVHTLLFVIRSNRNIPGEMLDLVFSAKQILQNALAAKERTGIKDG